MFVAGTIEKEDYMSWFIYNSWQEGNVSDRAGLSGLEGLVAGWMSL